MFHPGEIAAQTKAAANVQDWGSAHVAADIPPVGADFLREQRFVVLGVADDSGAVWADVLTGPRRFMDPAGPRTLVIEEEPGLGGGLLALLGLLEEEREVGLIAIEPWNRRRMRVNGRARRENGRLVVRTEQVYANCPKYIQLRNIVEEMPKGPGEVRLAPELDARQQAWISQADTFFVVTRADGLGVDASHRGGNPGFVQTTGSAALSWPDYVGNSMYMTLGNLELDARCGLLFPDWETGRTLHLTGRATTDWDRGRAERVPGAQRLVDFHVDQVAEVECGMPLRWSFGGYHRFNPEVAKDLR